MTANKLAITRPPDRSLEAYKTWIQSMVLAMGGTTGDASDEDWREMHAEFWGDLDKDEAA